MHKREGRRRTKQRRDHGGGRGRARECPRPGRRGGAAAQVAAELGAPQGDFEQAGRLGRDGLRARRAVAPLGEVPACAPLIGQEEPRSLPSSPHSLQECSRSDCFPTLPPPAPTAGSISYPSSPLPPPPLPPSFPLLASCRFHPPFYFGCRSLLAGDARVCAPRSPASRLLQSTSWGVCCRAV